MNVLRYTVVLTVLTACSGDTSTPTKPSDDSLALDSLTDSPSDTAPPVFDPSSDCEALGQPSLPFMDVGVSAKLYDAAADLTVQTTTGPWNLKENWSGCDVYLFIPDDPYQNGDVPYETWSKRIDNGALIDALPMNTHVFFLSSEGNEADRQVALDTLKGTIDAKLDSYDAETRAWRDRHIHYVTERSTDAEGWLGQTLTSPNWGAGIDRTQRIRYIGSMADPTRYDSNIGWFDSNIAMVANEAVYYNYEADRQASLDAENATVVAVWTGETVSGSAVMDVVLPDAATMATFDTLKLDMQMLCVGDYEVGECPAWDYLDYVYLCDKDNPDVCTTELGRYITTYHREGRWITDVSPLLALLKDGGTRRLRFESSNTYETTFSLRFSDSGALDRSSEAQVIYTGGGVSSAYNDRVPVQVDVPADVSRVEIGVVMTGHGNPGCMEFCGTEHNFNVNENDNFFMYALGDQAFGCMNQITDGTVPNQFGTWWYGRNGWCPGKQVNMQVVDVTSQIMFGQTNTINYTLTNLNGSLDSGGNIVLNAWLIYYR